MNELLNDLWQNQKPLLVTGFAFAALTAVLASLMFFDSTQILGISRWIKPVKFSSSIAVYLLTLAVFLFFLPGFERSKNVIAGGAILTMVGEIFFIVLQAARGTTSHFNTGEGFDGMVFPIMGFLIAVNTFLVIYLMILYFQAPVKLPSAVVWGMRLGLIVFILGSLEGGYISANMAHTVGQPDGGAGLPFVNWSTLAGDLRVAHFLGLHAFQAIPLFALTLVFLNRYIPVVKPTLLVVIFAAVYFAAFTCVFVQALTGKPLIEQKFLSGTSEQGKVYKNE